jgi:hypothetical protein
MSWVAVCNVNRKSILTAALQLPLFFRLTFVVYLLFSQNITHATLLKKEAEKFPQHQT